MSDNGTQISVLVVSQDQAVLEDARFEFPADVEVRTAGDAREAERVLRDFHPSVVVVDQKTGSAGGIALAHLMSQTKALREVPLLVLLEREQDAWLAHQAGATMHRIKPIAGETLAADALSLVS